MAQAQFRSLSKRVVDRLSVNGKDAIFWDRDLAGFGVRVYPSGKKVFVVQTRAFGRSKRVTLGTHGKLATEQARKNAAAVIARIKKGQPPAPPEPAPEPTVADLAERYQGRSQSWSWGSSSYCRDLAGRAGLEPARSVPPVDSGDSRAKRTRAFTRSPEAHAPSALGETVHGAARAGCGSQCSRSARPSFSNAWRISSWNTASIFMGP